MNNALIVLQILKKYSSENHCLTAEEINEKIGEEWPGISLNRKTIYSAIRNLNDYGMTTGEFLIESKGNKGSYYRQTLLTPSDIRQIIECIKETDFNVKESKGYLLETFLKLAIPQSLQDDILERESEYLPIDEKRNIGGAYGLLSLISDINKRRETGIFTLSKEAERRMTLDSPISRRDFHKLLLAPVSIDFGADGTFDAKKAEITFYYDQGRYQAEYYPFSVPLSYILSAKREYNENAEDYYRSFERKKARSNEPALSRRANPLDGFYFVAAPAAKNEVKVAPYFINGFMLLHYEDADEETFYIDPTLPAAKRLELRLPKREFNALSTLDGLNAFLTDIAKHDKGDQAYMTSRLIILSHLAYDASLRERFNYSDGYLETLLQAIKDLASPSYCRATFSSLVNATKTMPAHWNYDSLCEDGDLPFDEIDIDPHLCAKLARDNGISLSPTVFLLKCLLREMLSDKKETDTEFFVFCLIADYVIRRVRSEEDLLPLRRLLEYAVKRKSDADLSSLSLERVYGVFKKLYSQTRED